MNGEAARVLIVGPIPPPFHGVATFIRDLLGDRAPGGIGAQFHLEHLDTSDSRDASNLGRWDAQNLTLGFANLAAMAGRLLRSRHRLVYVPISQNVPAFLRDGLFIIQARLLGARVVVQLHGGYFRKFYEREAPGWFRAVARFVLNRATVVAVLSDEFRWIFKELVPEERIQVIENGVPDLFAGVPGNFQRGSGQAHISKTILYMSTLARTKGILELLQAVAILRRENPDVRLRAAGNWSDAEAESEAMELVKRENLQSCVEFVGNVDGMEKREFMSSGALFCLPTRYPYEGQPLAILEAMSAGLPVLATRHGAIGSTVLDGVTGCLIEREAGPEKLAAALRGMFADGVQLCALGAAGRRRYLEKYTLAACHGRLFEVFAGAIKQ